MLVDRVADFRSTDVIDEESEERAPVDDSVKVNRIEPARWTTVTPLYSTPGNNRSLSTLLIKGVGVDDVNGSDGSSRCRARGTGLACYSTVWRIVAERVVSWIRIGRSSPAGGNAHVSERERVTRIEPA